MTMPTSLNGLDCSVLDKDLAAMLVRDCHTLGSFRQSLSKQGPRKADYDQAPRPYLDTIADRTDIIHRTLDRSRGPLDHATIRAALIFTADPDIIARLPESADPLELSADAQDMILRGASELFVPLVAHGLVPPNQSHEVSDLVRQLCIACTEDDEGDLREAVITYMLRSKVRVLGTFLLHIRASDCFDDSFNAWAAATTKRIIAEKPGEGEDSMEFCCIRSIHFSVLALRIAGLPIPTEGMTNDIAQLASRYGTEHGRLALLQKVGSLKGFFENFRDQDSQRSLLAPSTT